MVRCGTVCSGQRLSCDMRQCAYESAHDYDAIFLSVCLHSTQTNDTLMHCGRGLSGGNPAFDRMGSSIGQLELRCIDLLRHDLPLSVSTFHCYLITVSRRL